MKEEMRLLSRALESWQSLSGADYETLDSITEGLNPHDYQRFALEALVDIAKGRNVSDDIVTYLKEKAEGAVDESERLCSIDELTGLQNRGALSREFEYYQAASEKADDDSFYVGMTVIDVNRFKEEANDKHGHSFGDDVLRYVAEGMRESTRVGDTLVRLSGDEFVILYEPLPYEAAFDVLMYTADTINSYIQKRIQLEHPGKEADVCVSIGMSRLAVDAADLPQLMKHADEAMYHAKRNPVSTSLGLLNIHIFDPLLSAEYVKRDTRRGRT
ncbi:GGDEF domain-containing protein [Candidatus Woesearchaeota archaeon]|nr:GGDEF domain-containing protein [Candidatus Woesearchaeota archaeon]